MSTPLAQFRQLVADLELSPVERSRFARLPDDATTTEVASAIGMLVSMTAELELTSSERERLRRLERRADLPSPE